jgi:peptidoglycan/xylan/chitin deacetylase (PgdA/CDA1 family)
MKILGSSLHRAVGRLQKRFVSSKGLILMYHAIGEVDLDPWGLYVTRQNFAQHLEVLQKYAQPISLQKLAQAHQDGNIPDRAISITFDDGYANNLLNAQPLLAQYDIPATVFTIAGGIGSNREFWWDELEQVLLQPGRLPQTLSLTLNGQSHQWELGATSDYSEADIERDRTHKVDESQPGSRLALYYSVWQKLQPLPESDRTRALDEIILWANAKPVARLTHRPLLPEELRTLAKEGLIEVGAHTVTHPLLSAHSVAFQQKEIQQSKADLEEVLECRVTSFSYPFGNYTPQTIKLVRQAGFDYACSGIRDTVWRNSDCFQLPRFEVQNWNGEKFAQQLLGWFDE